MHAFLLVPEDKNFINKLSDKKIEFPFGKIADVRNLANFTKLKLTEKTVVVLRDFDKSTEEAQNAFLKALEEPQKDLTYVLTASSTENVLPTVVSRCEIVEIPNSKIKIPNNIEAQINNFLDAEIGEKLKIISLITKREEAISFMQNLISVSHGMMLKNPNYKIPDEAMKTLKNLEANGNVPLQLINFVVNIG